MEQLKLAFFGLFLQSKTDKLLDIIVPDCLILLYLSTYRWLKVGCIKPDKVGFFFSHRRDEQIESES